MTGQFDTLGLTGLNRDALLEDLLAVVSKHGVKGGISCCVYGEKKLLGSSDSAFLLQGLTGETKDAPSEVSVVGDILATAIDRATTVISGEMSYYKPVFDVRRPPKPK